MSIVTDRWKASKIHRIRGHRPRSLTRSDHVEDLDPSVVAKLIVVFNTYIRTSAQTETHCRHVRGIGITVAPMMLCLVCCSSCTSTPTLPASPSASRCTTLSRASSESSRLNGTFVHFLGAFLMLAFVLRGMEMPPWKCRAGQAWNQLLME